MTFSHHDIQTQLRRILGSTDFVSSPRKSAFLQYVTDKTLAGEQAKLKGYTIGVDVFHKPQNFDPTTDTIVRVAARSLRQSLASYYHMDGIHDPIRIDLKPGSYVPVFSMQNCTTGSELTTFASAQSETLNPSTLGRKSAVESIAVTNSLPSATKRHWWVIASITALVMTALFFFIQKPSTSKAASQFILAKHLPVGPVVAVLPFDTIEIEGIDNIEIDPNILQAGVQFELAHKLSRFKDLYIINDSTAAPAGPREQAKSLHAQFYISGSIQVTASQIRVTSLLSQTDIGSVVWSETYQKEITSAATLLDIQSQIATNVATALGQPYSEMNARFLEESQKHDTVEINHYYCLLKFYDYNHQKSDVKHLEVRTCLENAVTANPKFSSGWAALSWIYGDEARNRFNPRIEKHTPQERALEAARKGITANPNNAMAHQYLAVAAFTIGEDAIFRKAAEAALELNPNDPEVLADIGSHLIQLDNSDIGRDLVNKAIAINPGHPSWYHGSITMYYYVRGQTDKALEHAMEYAMEYAIDGSLAARVLLAGTLMRENREEEALAVYRRHTEDYPYFETDPTQLKSWRLTEGLEDILLQDLAKIRTLIDQEYSQPIQTPSSTTITVPV